MPAPAILHEQIIGGGTSIEIAVSFKFLLIHLYLYLSNLAMPHLNPEILRQEDESVLLLESDAHQLILFNDDVNTFDNVIRWLIEICDHQALQAEQCAYLVHYTGKCTVKTGEFDELEPRASALLERGLTVEIQ
jgi:ATP-dependent Clp protease adaptor protein ClpS